jgi:ferredoxin
MELIGMLVFLAFGLSTIYIFLSFAWQNLRTKQYRAVWVSLFFCAVGAVLTLCAFFLPHYWLMRGAVALVGGIVLFMVLFFLPIGRPKRKNDTPTERVDERDIMFARYRLRDGAPEYDAYYAMRPENKKIDDRIRSKPGLLSLNAKYAHPLHFRAADASFSIPAVLREHVDGPVAEEQVALTADQITDYVKGLTIYYGAKTVGITELKPYHIYTHIGRGSGEYGAPVELDHQFAVAFTVEMAHDIMGKSPYAPEAMEAARQYTEAAVAAVQLANFIRSLGYEARAHIDGNYRVIAPLVARDAGLGEIGRIGLLISQEMGPRLRLGVVTTNLPLNPDKRKPDDAVLDFCRICNKCADNCPSRAISFENRQAEGGAWRWKIDHIRCFSYWNVIGTDCGRCMAVCPLAHAEGMAADFMRIAIHLSPFARRAALWLDDLFYGRKPKERPGPGWLKVDIE